ncbi:DUF3888 domain-containing protein [Bacillus sp. S14(2024)]|uniref:DUF3888 domain-containing protein n=1 Tax=Bacillus sp. S14(2024) TaxID=3162884 RepID=UPI003D22B681
MKDASKGVPQWAGWETELINVKQLNGVGGAYEVTVRVHPYYGTHTGIRKVRIVAQELRGKGIKLSEASIRDRGHLWTLRQLPLVVQMETKQTILTLKPY